MPMRTRAKSVVCRWAWIDLRPLCPARPPPTLTWTRPGGRSSSSWTTTSWLEIVDAEAAHQRAARPRPSRSCRWWGRRAPPGVPPMRTSADRGPLALGRPGAARPWRAASSATTSAPTLWRVPANSSPGLPSPTTSRSAGVPRRSGGRRPLASPRRAGAGPSPRRRSRPTRRRRRRPRPARPPRPRRRPPRPRRRPPRRRTRGGWPMTTAASGSTSVVTPAGRARSATRMASPMASSVMSTSTDGRDVGRPGLDRQGEQLLLDQAVAVVDLEGLARSG